MNKYQRISIISLTASVMLLVGCTTQTTTNDDTNQVDTNENTNTTANWNTNIATIGNTDENANSDQGSAVDRSDPALSEVEGWLTYENEEYGFSFRYPSDWTYKVEKTQSQSRILSDKKIEVIQLWHNENLMLSILPEGQFDHEFSADMVETYLTQDGKDLVLFANSNYQIYRFVDYPASGSSFRVESHADTKIVKSIIKQIISTLDFNS